MPAKNICVLASGGMDSCVLIGELLRSGQEVHPLYIRSGFRWEAVELYWLRRFLGAVKTRKLKELTVGRALMAGLLKKHWSLGGPGVPPAGSPWDSVYLPGRNLTLLSHAAVFAAQRSIGTVAMATLKGNPFLDAAPAFHRRMEKVFATGLGRKIKVLTPYSRLSKAGVIGRSQGLPLRLTFSCLKPRGKKHCGVCSKCEERLCLGL